MRRSDEALKQHTTYCERQQLPLFQGRRVALLADREQFYFPAQRRLSSENYIVLFRLSLSHVHDTTNAITLLHDIKRLVDVLKSLAVRDELIDLQLALQIIINQVWKLAAAFNTAESTALPDAPSDKLECYGECQ